MSERHICWYWEPCVDRDVYNLYVLWYDVDEDDVVHSFYLHPHKGWIECAPYDAIEPLWCLDGLTALELAGRFDNSEIDRSAIAKALVEELRSVFAILEEPEDATVTPPVN